MIYKNPSGTYGYIMPINGTLGGVDPGGRDSLPDGTEFVTY
jgi:hypothetical protein